MVLSVIIAVAFLFAIYKFLPLGIAFVITGACMAFMAKTANDKIVYYVGLLGSWLYPIGIIFTFFYNGWKLGILSIFIGLITYRYAKK